MGRARLGNAFHVIQRWGLAGTVPISDPDNPSGVLHCSIMWYLVYLHTGTIFWDSYHIRHTRYEVTLSYFVCDTTKYISSTLFHKQAGVSGTPYIPLGRGGGGYSIGFIYVLDLMNGRSRGSCNRGI